MKFLFSLLFVLSLVFTSGAQTSLSKADQQTVKDLEKRLNRYAKDRQKLLERQPKIVEGATPEQIEAYKLRLQEAVQAIRVNARPGDFLTQQISLLIRDIINRELPGYAASEVRQSVLEADTKGVPVKVNMPYPATKELVEMSPALLLALPRLPDSLRYRFIGSNLVIMDKDNSLILDFISNALPTRGSIAAAGGSAKEPSPAANTLNTGVVPAGPPTTLPGGLKVTLPMEANSLKFLAIGDTGSGTAQQAELARVMTEYLEFFPYKFVIMMGDNMYGGEKPEDFKEKFEDVYKPILDRGVKFYASLGNHDEAKQRFYANFNMGGEEYYRFNVDGVSFYALNSNYMEKKQIEWLEKELSSDGAKWKIPFFHHPPYSSGGKHGSSTSLRKVVEPIFVKYGVDVVFTGHEHFYERIKPQQGIHYFITGAGGKLRSGDVRENSPITAKAYDQDLSFMLVEITENVLHFQVINRKKETVDSGGIPRRD
jgi:predicted phosphodiesterase